MNALNDNECLTLLREPRPKDVRAPFTNDCFGTNSKASKKIPKHIHNLGGFQATQLYGSLHNSRSNQIRRGKGGINFWLGEKSRLWSSLSPPCVDNGDPGRKILSFLKVKQWWRECVWVIPFSLGKNGPYKGSLQNLPIGTLIALLGVRGSRTGFRRGKVWKVLDPSGDFIIHSGPCFGQVRKVLNPSGGSGPY